MTRLCKVCGEPVDRDNCVRKHITETVVEVYHWHCFLKTEQDLVTLRQKAKRALQGER